MQTINAPHSACSRARSHFRPAEDRGAGRVSCYEIDFRRCCIRRRERDGLAAPLG